ncbi:hypothetical protein RYX36_011704 [Vicia faba]
MAWKYVILTLLHGVHITLLFRSLVLDQEKSKFVTGSTRKIMRGLLLHEDPWFWTRKNRSLSLVLRERSCVDCCYMKILGFGPGKIEVCHWFYEKDHAWTVAT